MNIVFLLFPLVKKLFRLPALLVALLVATPVFFTSCDEDTAGIGSVIMPEQDNVISTQKTYALNTRTVLSDSVMANTNDSYLGRVIDPETRAMTTCNFLAQFHVLEDTKFPERAKLLNDEQGRIQVDSCDIRIFIKSYYGDSLATMKMNVQELDTNKVIKENETYYTNLDASRFITEGVGIKTSMSYAVKDLSRPDSPTDGITYYRSILVKLPVEYGRHLMEKYYENPDYYKNSYQFIHHVCPGFYFNITGGVGSMITAHTTTLNVYFRHHTTNVAGNDTIIDGMQRMAATEEVIQQTTIGNRIPEELTAESNEYTFIKSPAGLFTEVELPVGDIVAGEHYTDTINSAAITFQRHNDTTESKYNLSSPGHILMLRKADVYTFFEKNSLPNSVDSYISTFNRSYNAYTFTNIAKLISLLRDERDKGAGVTPIMTEEERNNRYTAWEADHPDWNKVLLVPIKAEYSANSTDYYGYTTSSSLISVKNLLGMNSVRLRGGNGGKVEIQIVYSRFSQ